jgi:hypothetical protein
VNSILSMKKAAMEGVGFKIFAKGKKRRSAR